MILKNWIVSIVLVVVATAPQVNVRPYDSNTKSWSGYNPVCDQQCTLSNGSICGTTIRQCCQRNQCVNQYGFQICNQPLSGFDCQQDHYAQKLRQFLRDHGFNFVHWSIFYGFIKLFPLKFIHILDIMNGKVHNYTKYLLIALIINIIKLYPNDRKSHGVKPSTTWIILFHVFCQIHRNCWPFFIIRATWIWVATEICHI